uniref:RING-type domain-containing protein n=1 Tax=Trepomonas sp. PC1 TaxID=1076344 RepID=A0A146KJA4_9EUKA|eukprot:JAP95715.1 hypothetical protein TPC1_11196 [Trepomonas sp. PC1]
MELDLFNLLSENQFNVEIQEADCTAQKVQKFFIAALGGEGKKKKKKKKSKKEENSELEANQSEQNGEVPPIEEKYLKEEVDEPVQESSKQNYVEENQKEEIQPIQESYQYQKPDLDETNIKSPKIQSKFTKQTTISTIKTLPKVLQSLSPTRKTVSSTLALSQAMYEMQKENREQRQMIDKLNNTIKELNQQLDQALQSQTIDASLREENIRLRQENKKLLEMLQGKFAKQIPTSAQEHNQTVSNITVANPYQTHIFSGVKKDGLYFSNFEKPVPKKYVCPLCLEPFITPMELKCGHVFCAQCLEYYENFCEMDQENESEWFQCPGCVESNGKYLKCQEKYQSSAYSELLDKEICEFFNIDHYDQYKIGDYVRIFGEDVAVVTVLGKKLTVQSLTGLLIRTQAYNVRKLEFQHFSMRCKIGDIVFPLGNIKIATIDHNAFTMQDRFALQSNFYFGREFYIVQKYDNGFYYLKGQNSQKIEQNFNSYVSLFVPVLREHSGCKGCKGDVVVPVRCKCGCVYCSYCFHKMVQNKIPCFEHLVELIQEEISFQSAIDVGMIVTYDAKNCFVSQNLTDEQIVVQTLDKKQIIVDIGQVKPLNTNILKLAFKPSNGDICLLKEPNTLQYGIMVENQFITLDKAYVLYSVFPKLQKMVIPSILDSKLCQFCFKLVKNQTILPCGHCACRYCVIHSVYLGEMSCRECGQKFEKVPQPNSQDVDYGSLCAKATSRVYTDSIYGFVRSIGDTLEIGFFQTINSFKAKDLRFINISQLKTSQSNLKAGSLCMIMSGKFTGVVGLFVNDGKMMSEIGLAIEEDDIEALIE